MVTSSAASLSELTVLQTLTAMADLTVLLLNPEARLLEMSSAARPYFPTLGPGDELDRAWGLTQYQHLRTLLIQAHDTREMILADFAHPCADGAKAHLMWKIRALWSPEDRLLGYALVGDDRTSQEHLEHELQKSLRLIRDQKMALDESSIVAMTDQRGVILYVNETFCRISGYTSEELIGKTHAILKSNFHPPEFFRDLWRTIASGRVWKGEIKNHNKNGEDYWVDTTIVPFMNESGKPYQYIAIRNDITEKKSIQAHLEQERMRTMHAEKMASLGELAAGIAHELGNPTASINAWLDVIESQYERESLNIEVFMQTLPKVRRDAKRIRDIIRGMLAYARDGSRDPFQSESPQTIVQQVVDYCSYKIRKVGVQVSIEVTNPYINLECRITEISQMLVNFVLNACDAVQELPERWIKIRVLEQGQSIAFEITDSGHGIPDHIAERIFNPFFTTKPIGRGTGLGLSIAKSIIDNHQGTIALDHACSNTRFIITLPKRHKEGK
jgi:PAS domain S-box-containing protein